MSHLAHDKHLIICSFVYSREMGAILKRNKGNTNTIWDINIEWEGYEFSLCLSLSASVRVCVCVWSVSLSVCVVCVCMCVWEGRGVEKRTAPQTSMESKIFYKELPSCERRQSEYTHTHLTSAFASPTVFVHWAVFFLLCPNHPIPPLIQNFPFSWQDVILY